VLFSSEEQRHTLQLERGFAQQNRSIAFLSKVRAWAILGDLGGRLGSTANPPLIKPGSSVSGHMAQFATVESHVWR
jgi:hypothetical protein